MISVTIAVENERKKELNVDKAGNFLILSSLDAKPRTIYHMYKTRCAIEDVRYRQELYIHGQNVYAGRRAHDGVSVHIFHGSDGIDEDLGMDRFGRMTVKDVLDTYSVMKKVTVKDVTVTQTVLKNVAESDKILDLHLFTKKRIPKKQGRKPKNPHIH